MEPTDYDRLYAAIQRSGVIHERKLRAEGEFYRLREEARKARAQWREQIALLRRLNRRIEELKESLNK